MSLNGLVIMATILLVTELETDCGVAKEFGSVAKYEADDSINRLLRLEDALGPYLDRAGSLDPFV